MLSIKTINALKERYNSVHPLIFQRSLDHARNDVDLFDILDSLPKTYPLTWDEQSRRWITTKDLFLSSKFRIKG